MKIISWEEILNGKTFFADSGSALTVGSFDGPHKGHYEIFKKVLAYSKEKGTTPVIVTFTRSLTGIKHADDYMGDISSLHKRLLIFEALGFKYCLLIDFSDDFAKLKGDEFFAILKNQLNMRYVCEGEDFSCGNKGSFNAELIKAWAEKNNVNPEFIELVKYNGKRISSSDIRTLLCEHQNKKAESLLIDTVSRIQ